MGEPEQPWEDKVANARGLDPISFSSGARKMDIWRLSRRAATTGSLLSTGNSFPATLRAFASRIAGGEADTARKVSNQLTDASTRLFAAASSVGSGNAFSNANRAADHGLLIGVANHRSDVSLNTIAHREAETNRPAPPPFLPIMARRRRCLAAA